MAHISLFNIEDIKIEQTVEISPSTGEEYSLVNISILTNTGTELLHLFSKEGVILKEIKND